MRGLLEWQFGKRFTLFDVIALALVVPKVTEQWGVVGFVVAFCAWAAAGMAGERAIEARQQ